MTDLGSGGGGAHTRWSRYEIVVRAPPHRQGRSAVRLWGHRPRVGGLTAAPLGHSVNVRVGGRGLPLAAHGSDEHVEGRCPTAVRTSVVTPLHTTRRAAGRVQAEPSHRRQEHSRGQSNACSAARPSRVPCRSHAAGPRRRSTRHRPDRTWSPTRASVIATIAAASSPKQVCVRPCSRQAPARGMSATSSRPSVSGSSCGGSSPWRS